MIALLIALMVFMGCVLQAPDAGTGATPGQTEAASTDEMTSGTPAAEGTAEPAATPTIVSAPQSGRIQNSGPPAMTLESGADYFADFRTTQGNFRVQLLATQAPVTVNNFVFLAQQGFYNGLTFHRVIENFMIQGGDPTGTGGGGPGYQFEDEIVPGLVFDTPGKLAMANSGPGTNGSQFFITTVPADWLNGRHTIFGTVAQGQSVVDAISRVPTGGRDAPVQSVVIEQIDIVRDAGE